MTTSLEESVIASLISNQELLHKIPFRLSDNDFYNAITKNIYRVIAHLLEQNKPINRSTILTTSDELKVTVDKETLDGICKDAPSEDEGLLFLKQLKVKHIKKQESIKQKALEEHKFRQHMNRLLNPEPESRFS